MRGKQYKCIKAVEQFQCPISAAGVSILSGINRLISTVRLLKRTGISGNKLIIENNVNEVSLA